MFLDFISLFSVKFYRYFSLPIIKLWCVISFLFKYIFFGYENAFQSLNRYDKYNLKLIMKLLGAKIGKNCEIESGIRFHNCKNLKNLTISDNCHIGKDCFFDLRGKVIIEKNVTVSMKTNFITHQDLGFSNLNSIYGPSFSNITIKKNSYIGANTTILYGVTVGECSIVAASSCIVKSTEPKTLYGGVPAKKIKDISGIQEAT